MTTAAELLIAASGGAPPPAPPPNYDGTFSPLWFTEQMLKLIFWNQQWPNIGTPDGLLPTDPAGFFYLRLHYADPGVNGLGTTNEVFYGGYAPGQIYSGPSSWNIINGRVSNKLTVVCPTCTSGTIIATYWSICTTNDVNGAILFKGEIPNPINIFTGIIPGFSAGQLAVSYETPAATEPLTAAAIATAVMNQATTTPIHADVKKMNSATMLGDGTSGNKWRG